jgi:protein-L-isoaspartate(D-aspartate) O-methyltransferase
MTSARTRQRLVRRLWEEGIRNEEVLEAIISTPRHMFVDEALASRAYEDTALPIGFGQTISQPFIVARMTEILLDDFRPRKVLEVGTGSGYQTAVLAALVEHVYSVERIGKLLERARQTVQALGLSNVLMKHDDGHLGWPRYAPYEAIVVTAAAQEIPMDLLRQLTMGGRLIAPMGNQNAQQLVMLERKGAGIEKRVLDAVVFVPLLGGVL